MKIELTQHTKTFAAKREWAGDSVIHLSDFPALFAAWQHSQQLLNEIQQTLAAEELDPDYVRCVAVSGSLGRMEAVTRSDCDLIVVCGDNFTSDTTAAQSAWNSVWAALEPLELPRPRAGGIYTAPTTEAELCDPATRGRVDEDIPTFGKRFQLLWDAQPVSQPEQFEQLIHSVIAWYTATPEGESSTCWWRYLLNDLIRYYRSLCVQANWNQSQGLGRWRMRNFKLAHSRVVMYAALLCLLGECSLNDTAPTEQLCDLLHLTPLERLAICYERAQQSGFERIARCYDRFLALSGDEEFRQAMQHGSEDTVLPTHLQWHENAAELSEELSRFLGTQQQDRWGAAFLRALWV